MAINETLIKTSSTTTAGTAASDTWTINTASLDTALTISGGTSGKDNLNRDTSSLYDENTTYTMTETELLATDSRVNYSYYYSSNTGVGTSISTANSYLYATPNATDMIFFKKSGDFTNLSFEKIEKIKLAEGVSITLSGEAVGNDVDSLDLGKINPGVHFYGTAGGKQESVTFNIEGYWSDTGNTDGLDEDTELNFQDKLSTSDSTYSGTHYAVAELQLDDASTGNLSHDGVKLIYDFSAAFEDFDTTYTYTRVDGTNDADYVYGSAGVDYFTTRAGNDVIYAGKGNDVIAAAGGADKVYMKDGNDIYLVNGFRGLTGNGEGKTSNGSEEWTDGDVVDGGNGWDIFRVTAGSKANDTGRVELTNANFKGMEEVQVGATVSASDGNDSTTQKILNHFYLKANTTVADGTGVKEGESISNVVIDASAVGNKLTFTGNGNANTFIGTMFGDKFYGNGGHDTLTGGAGKDGFYFGLAHAYTGNAYADSTQTYTASSDYDTITDFISGKDKIYLDKDLFSAWDAIGKISTAELEIGEDHTTAMTDSKIYLEVDSDNDVAHLYYVAGASNEQIVDLIGVSTIIANDIAIFNGSPAAVTL